MSFSANYPTISPTLLLDFAGARTLDPRVTFARASTATYYDIDTSAKAEENSLSYSQEFNQSVWNSAGFNTTITANTSVAPDGTTTADTLTANATTSVHYVLQVASTAGTQRVFSAYVKAGTTNLVQLAFGTDNQAYANFDLTAGAGSIGNVGSNTTASIVDAGNGWYRCIISVSSATAAAALIIVLIPSLTATRIQSWTAAGTENVFIWGAQCEQRSAVTAYTATTTQPITNYVPVLLTAAVNVPRLTFNPVTRQSLGLLVEEARTNLLTYSEQFDNAAWTKSNGSISANATVAIDGTLSADKFIPDTTNANHACSVSISYTSGTSYTISIYAKAGGYSWVRPMFPAAAFTSLIGAYFDLTNGVVGTVSSGVIASIISVGNGWYRCSITAAATATASGSTLIYVSNVGTTVSFAGDGYSGAYIWGAQLEAGAFSTSYIPTVASTVTRAVENASMTGVNFSGWYNQNEGTLISQFRSSLPADSSNAFVYSVNQDGFNYIAIRTSGGYTPDRLFPAVVSGGVTQFTGESTASTGYITLPIGFVENALAYKANDFSSSFNGLNPYTDNSGTLPNPTQIYIGTSNGTASSINGTIAKIAYYSQRLPNSQLQALTGS